MMHRALFSAIGLVFLFLTGGCAHSTPPTVPNPQCTSCVDKSEGETWSLGVPEGWKVVNQASEPGRTLRIEGAIQTSEKIGRARGFAVVMTTPWKNKKSQFSFDAVVALLENPEFTLLSVEPVVFKSHVGTLAVFTVGSGEIVLLQLAVVHEGIGHVVRCGGDAVELKRVLTECSQVYERFDFKTGGIVVPSGALFI